LEDQVPEDLVEVEVEYSNDTHFKLSFLPLFFYTQDIYSHL